MREDFEIKITDWNSICLMFEEMFEGLGKVEISENLVSFQSIQPHVATGISLDSKGRILANMPLHSIETEFDIVKISADKRSIKLIGGNSSYVYHIPSEILNSRNG